MSKMDYATLAVVALCITALVVLTSRVVNLGKNETTTLPSAISSEPAYKDPYNNHAAGSLDDSLDQSGAKLTDTAVNERLLADNPNPVAKSTTPKQPIREKVIELEKTRPKTKEPIVLHEPAVKTIRENPSTTTRVVRHENSGAYLVVAGSFKSKANAQKVVKQLKTLGYSNAEVGFFNNRTIAAPLAGRYATLAAANAAALSLRQKHGIDAIVKRKQ
jgi:cell division septation protein DedD